MGFLSRRTNAGTVAVAIAVVVGLGLGGACSDDPRPVGASQSSVSDADRVTPGQGVRVSMARATWSTGYVQAAIYWSLLRELGYEVNDPTEAEMASGAFYRAMAEGRFDFWVNGWFPQDMVSLEDAGLTGVARPIGVQIADGGLQGFLVDMATADAHGITKLDDIGDNPEIAALFDIDGDGRADLMGCDDGWNCRIVIDDTIAANGWEETIEQVSADHSVLFTDSLARHQRGEPVLQFVWTPGLFTSYLVPGRDVIWLSLDNPIPSQPGAADLPVDECPGQPCQMGFTPADIRVVARNDFLAANPAAATLFEMVAIPAADVSRHVLEFEEGANSESDVKAAAARWIAENRATVDGWLEAARASSK